MSLNKHVKIRDARPEDMPQVNAILTHYALHTIATFASSGIRDEEMLAKYHSLKSERAGKLPFFVATKASLSREVDTVVGYAYLYPYRLERLAYEHTAEMSLYLHPDHRKGGIGTRLLSSLLDEAKATKIRQIIAVAALNTEEKMEDSG